MSIQLLTTAEVARMLGYSSQFVRDLCASGKLAAVRLGHGSQWRITRDSVERLAGRKSEPDKESNRQRGIDAARRAGLL